MLGPSHAAIGAAAGVATAHLLGADVALAHAMSAPQLAGDVASGLLSAPVAAVAALLPDLDEPHSTLGQLLPRWWHALTPGHRRCTHSLLAVVLVGLGVHLGLGALGVSGLALFTATALVVTGMASHLVADGITDRGVPLFWPTRRHFGLPLFATGTWPEHLVVLLVVVGAAAWALGAVSLARGGLA